MPTISHDSLREYGAAIFAAAGFPADQGRDVTEHLVDSNLVGHDSHGVIRLPGYITSVREGSMKPVGKLKIVRETPVSLVIDAQRMQGIVLAKKAMEMAVERAKEHTFGAVAVHQSTHIGRLGAFSTNCRATELYRLADVERRWAVYRAFWRYGTAVAPQSPRFQRAARRRGPPDAGYDDKHGRRG